MADKIIRGKRPLSREESKLVTRHRLLGAGMSLLGEHGYEQLTTGRIAERAGVAQPTFYVHFRDKDDLLQTIASDAVGKLRTALRDARSAIHRGGEPVTLAHDTFRLALETLAKQPDLLRLFVAELHRPRSAFGQSARALVAEVAADLVADVRAAGFAKHVHSEDLARSADAIVMLTIHFAMAHVEGREPELEPLVRVLARTSLALLVKPI